MPEKSNPNPIHPDPARPKPPLHGARSGATQGVSYSGVLGQPATQVTAIPDLRSVLSPRLDKLGRNMEWLAAQGRPLIKRTHFSYPKESDSSHRKTSLPSDRAWASLAGVALDLRPGTVAALILRWQWEKYRSGQLAAPDDNGALRWPLGTSLSDAFANSPPTDDELRLFEAGRVAALESDIDAAFHHLAVERIFSAFRQSASHLAYLAVHDRWLLKPVFDQTGKESQHLIEALKAPGPGPEACVVSVPRAVAAEGLLRIARLAHGGQADPLTYDWLCDLAEFRRRPTSALPGGGEQTKDVRFYCGLVTTFRDNLVAVLPRDEGPWHHGFGLYDLAAPDPDATPSLARQVATHRWRALDAQSLVQLEPMGLMLHRPVADHRPEDGPILLTYLWLARLDGHEPPTAGHDGVRWMRIPDIFAPPDYADRAILLALRRNSQAAPSVIESGSAQLVNFFSNSDICVDWKRRWESA